MKFRRITTLERRRYTRLLKRICLRRYGYQREAQAIAAQGKGPTARALAMRAPY